MAGGNAARPILQKTPNMLLFEGTLGRLVRAACDQH